MELGIILLLITTPISILAIIGIAVVENKIKISKVQYIADFKIKKNEAADNLDFVLHASSCMIKKIHEPPMSNKTKKTLMQSLKILN
ncbi:MAG: hypothetical protein WCL06_00140 [Bacteroidota bacterium]